MAESATNDDLTLFPIEMRDPEHRDQLLTFRDEVQQQQLVGYFISQDDLVDKVAAALHQYLLDAGHPGHIPHDRPPRVPGFVGRADELA